MALKPLRDLVRYPAKVYRFAMASRKRQLAATGVVSVLVLASLLVINGPASGEGDPATLNDLLNSVSERTGLEQGGSVVVSDSSPWLAVIGAPVACYYDNVGSQQAVPLLVAGDEPSLPVKRFLGAIDSERTVTIGQVGELGVPVSYRVGGEDVKHASLESAKEFWAASDGAMIVRPGKEGYALAVAAAALASYVNIPVIVTDEVCEGVTSSLSGLGVSYTIALGDAPGYGKVLRLRSVEEIQDLMTTFIREPRGLASDVSYLTVANPEDIVPMVVETSTTYHFEDLIYDHSTRDTGIVPATTAVDNQVEYEFDIPADYSYALVRFTLKFRANAWADEIGSRIYAWVFDSDDTDEAGAAAQELFFGTPAGRIEGEYRIVDFDGALNNDQGTHLVQLGAREIWAGRPPGPFGKIQAEPDWFYLDIVVQKLASPVYPLMEGLSSLAPYLTAYRQGIVMADPEYALMSPAYLGCVDCGEPTFNSASMATANIKAMDIHNETVHTLARLVGQDSPSLMDDGAALNALADHYYRNPIGVGIIADTNMVPHYYFPGGEVSEGYGEPGDIHFADVNMDPMNAPMDLGEGKVSPSYPDIELPVGRIDGYDARDCSALLARTFFYREIIDNFQGYTQGNVHSDWKSNGYVFLGSELPVETMYPSLITQVSKEYDEGGFNPKQTSEILSHRINSQKFQEGSNYIIGGVHGFYYWYVPSARTKYAGGSAYDVAHVRDMDFGPSTMYLISCVVGRIDGLDPENALSQAYIHGGINAFIGATRSTYGTIDAGSDEDLRLDPEGAVLMGEYFTEYVLGDDKTVGMALRDAKNDYLPEDAEGGIANGIGPEIAYIIYGHYILHGDPMFNPYEPNHG